MKKLIDEQNRGKLGEGRNYGLGFAFVKKIDEDTYETVQPISACKDYLNDVVYAEHTGKNCSAYGLSADKQGIFSDNLNFLVTKELHYLSGMNYKDFDAEQNQMVKNYPNLQKLINLFEEQLNFVNRTRIFEMDNVAHLFEMPIGWCDSTYMISLYSLLIRNGRWYDGEKEPIDYLTNLTEFDKDRYLLNDAIPKMKDLLNTKLFKQDWSKVKPHGPTHNRGILAYNSKNEDLIK